MAVYGYARVSTKSQLDNNSLEQQEQEILAKYENANVVKEQFSGATTNRPKLNWLLNNKLKEGDTLVVCKLDRLARNTVEGIEIVQSLFDKGVSVHVLNVGLLENTTMGKFFLTTLLAVAEMERNTIIERTQAGKEIAKKNPNFREGRPKVHSKKKVEHAIELLEETDATGKRLRTYKQVEEMTGISKATIVRARKAKREAE